MLRSAPNFMLTSQSFRVTSLTSLCGADPRLLWLPASFLSGHVQGAFDARAGGGAEPASEDGEDVGLAAGRTRRGAKVRRLLITQAGQRDRGAELKGLQELRFPSCTTVLPSWEVSWWDLRGENPTSPFLLIQHELPQLRLYTQTLRFPSMQRNKMAATSALPPNQSSSLFIFMPVVYSAFFFEC